VPNIKQSEKRVRQAEKRRLHNKSRRSKMRTYIKKADYAAQAGDLAKAKAAYQELEPILDRYATKGLIHKNKAARHKSRINAKIKALES
jgi:small subunit ribosomal protein S20